MHFNACGPVLNTTGDSCRSARGDKSLWFFVRTNPVYGLLFQRHIVPVPRNCKNIELSKDMEVSRKSFWKIWELLTFRKVNHLIANFKIYYSWRCSPLFGNSVNAFLLAKRNFRKSKPKSSVQSKALINTVDTITCCRKKKKQSPLCRMFVFQFSLYCAGPCNTISWHWKG